MTEISVLVQSTTDFRGLTEEEQKTRVEKIAGEYPPWVQRGLVNSFIGTPMTASDLAGEKSLALVIRQMAQLGALPVLAKLGRVERLKHKLEAKTSEAVGILVKFSTWVRARRGNALVHVAAGEEVDVIGCETSCTGQRVTFSLSEMQAALYTLGTCEATGSLEPILRLLRDRAAEDGAPAAVAAAAVNPHDLGVKHNAQHYAKCGVKYASDVHARFITDVFYSLPDETLLDQYNLLLAQTAFGHELRAASIRRQNHVSALVAICTTKLRFAPARLRTLAQLRSPELVYSALTPAERKIVVSEYEHRQAYVKAVMGNTCPHIESMRRFSAAKTADTFARVIALADKGKSKGLPTDGWIQCKLCHMDMICPHTVALQSAGEKFYDAMAVLTKFATNTKRAGSAASDSFCKICNEIIVAADAFADLREPPQLMDEELKIMAWAEVASIMRFVRMTGVVNTRHVITCIRDSIYPYLFEVEKQVIRSKTANADEINAKKRLFASIFAFAMLVKISAGGKTPIAGFIGIPAGTPVPAMLKHAIEQIIMTKNVLIKAIPGMTSESIQNQVVSAYKVVNDVIDFESAGTSEPLEITLMLDPVFDYMFGRVELAGDSKPAKKRLPRTERKFAAVKNWFGAAKAGDASIFTLVPDVKPPMSMKNVSAADNSPAAVAALGWASYVQFRKRVLAAGTLGAFPSEDHAALDSAEAAIKAREASMIVAGAARRLKGFGTYPIVGSRLWRPLPSSLARIYDEKGLAHVWKVTNTDGVIDYKCSVCGIMRSTATEVLDDALIAAALAENTRTVNFFKFYALRCPLGGMHNFVADVCQACKLTRGDRPGGYMKQYLDTWTAATATEIPVEAPPPVYQAPDPAEFAFNFNSIIDCGERLGIPYRMLNALGAYEKVQSAVLSGDFIAPEPDTRNHPRILQLRAHVRTLFGVYNVFRNHRPNNVSDAIVRLAEQAKVRVENIPGDLPDVYGDFNEKFAWMYENAKPRVIVEFLLQSICDKLLMIARDGVPLTIAKFIANKMIKSELVMCEPGEFNWSLVYPDSHVPDVQLDDEPVVDDEEDEKPFSMDAFDVEQDQDSDSNQIRVGENLGML